MPDTIIKGSTIKGGTIGPSLTTSGLVLHLDAGNPSSYPGTGTTWTDLSGNGNNGTLVNGPAYSSANGGNIVFDGSNDYISFSGFTINTNTGFTFDIWIDTQSPQVSTTGWGYFYGPAFTVEIGSYAVSGGIVGSFIFKDNSATPISETSFPIDPGTFYNATVGCSSTTPFVYKNGYFYGTSSNFVNRNLLVSNLMRNQSTGTYNYKARLAIVRIYNRALSSSEILQNFLVNRDRFGL